MASTTVLMSAAMALFATVSGAPVEKRQIQSCDTLSPVVDPTAPMRLFSVPRYAETDNNGCDIVNAINAGPITYLDIEQPSGPATDGQRFISVQGSSPYAQYFNLSGGYITTSLPIPKSEPPMNATWSSDNQLLYPDGAGQGGMVPFSVENEGADGGLDISLTQGALYLDKEKTANLEPDYAIWKMCDGADGPYLAFNGTDSASCQSIYLVGCNKGNCPA